MARFEERAPLDWTKPSKVQVIRVCPHCKCGNQVGKNWFAGDCRECGKMFNADQALPESEMEGFQVVQLGTMDPAKTKMKGEMENRAHEYAQEVNQMKQDGGQRKRGHKSPLWKHFDGESYR